ncbi:MAG: hypothetical protein M1826_002927 [Phylliscum demangeonii]|nr:MAG: hypothetical protein M1826_002927 [Phylliscum demangeonii]
MLVESFLWLTLLPWLAQALGPTDSIQDADPPQSGYLPSHNIDPSIVGSSIFGILWQNSYDPKELWYAKPLVYTPNNGKQLVFLASSQNWIRTVDAATGSAINGRKVQEPFLQSDIGCTDIPDYIGIIGTPVLDPNTETVYFFSKGYKNGASFGGVGNGIYNFYAVDINTLTDRPGFPILVDGHFADNDPARYFIGGTVLQRPSLALINGIVYGAFGGHCDKYNYTGMVLGISTQPNVGVVSLYAMEASPFAPPVVSDILLEQGGKAGIWQGGMGLATDGSRIFFNTGNGLGHQNQDTPASGRTLLSTLDECVVNLGIGANGKLSLSDWFEPYEYIGLDAGDLDLGSGGVALLDPAAFSGGSVSRLAVAIGKNGKAYILNADNLGGYKLGSGGTDNVIQSIDAAGPIFGGSGSYPLEGGFIYFTPIGRPTVAYKLGRDAAGNPVFSKVGQSAESSAGRVGVGVPTVTTNEGQPGTGILWVTDVDAGLRAYHAVPDANGNLVRISLPPTNGLNKFQRPAFGDGRLYVTDVQGRVTCLGSPVALPLKCTSPVSFGSVLLGSKSTQTVTCTALIPINSLAGLVTSDPSWQASNSSLPQGPLSAGQQFSFPVVWDLTGTQVQDAKDASYSSVSPGVKSGSVIVYTSNGVAQYSNSYPVSLSGIEVSAKPFLQLSPSEVDFGGLVLGSPGAPSGIDSSFLMTNSGNQTLTITGYGYTTDPASQQYQNGSATNTGYDIGASFTSTNLPPLSGQINSGQSVTVPINFKASAIGSLHTVFRVWSDGGSQSVLITGSATTAPIANFSVSTNEGGYDPSPAMDFGRVLAGTTATRRIRICNSGGSPLEITKSKPPIQPELRAENPGSDLHEGQFISPNDCAYGAVDIAAAPEPVNSPDHAVSDSWTLNTADVNFGIHEVKISAVIYSPIVGPTLANGSARYDFLGCYNDASGRVLSQQNTPLNNSNGPCQTLCLQNGYTFAGTEYHSECWCGNSPPPASKYSPPSASKCTFSCPGDSTQSCGGDGGFIDVFYDTSKYTPGCDSRPCPGSPGASGPVINPGDAQWRYLSCYLDPTTPPAKALSPFSELPSDAMTVAVCLRYCQGLGAVYAGVEYGRECYCSGTLQKAATADDRGCTMTCAANGTEFCGGPSRMMVYEYGTSAALSVGPTAGLA